MAKSFKPQDQQPAADGGGQRAQGPVYPPGFNPVSKAKQLHEAMDCWGTDERVVLDVLRTGRQDLTRAIESSFNRMYSRSLRSWLHKELSGGDLTKALQLLGRGDFTLAQKLNQAADGWGVDSQKIFRALETATPAELQEVRDNARLRNRLKDELNDDDYDLALAYLNGKGVLAARLRRAVGGWGTDEEQIWRSITKASDEEKQFILTKPALMKALRSDLNDADYLRASRMLGGTWDNADKIEVAMAGWGTDEAQLKAAISGLTAAEFQKLAQGTTRISGIPGLITQLTSELSGDTEFEALESLHQKRLAYDTQYAVEYRAEQGKKLGESAMADEGSAALIAAEGQSMSAVSRLKMACRGWNTDEESIWDVCASIPSMQGQWILRHNPDGILRTLKTSLSVDEYIDVRRALGGGAIGRIQVLRAAVEGLGTNEQQLYDAIGPILDEKLGSEVLHDASIMSQIRNDLDPRMYRVFEDALTTGTFTSMMRLKWATARYGTDEDLVWKLCENRGSEWHTGGEIKPEVDQILKDELSTRDYWRAIDLIRGPAEGEQAKLERAKELLERERGSGISVALMDMVSGDGQHADESWRDYQVVYNQAYEDGKISEEEQGRLSDAEEYSNYTTEQYREAKATVAQWASQIAVTIVGIVATVLTAGAAAGPFLVALGSNMGTICTSMVTAAALKVGISKAIEGEGYDLDSLDTLVDGVGAAVEAGLFVVGNVGAANIMRGASKTKFVQGIAPSVEKTFGSAGKRILAGGFEGAIDGSIGGLGEGIFQGLASDRAWSGGLGEVFSNVGATTMLHTALGGTMGFAGGSAFRSIGETVGPALRRNFGNTVEGAATGSNSVDDIMAKMPDDLEGSTTDQRRLLLAAHETNQRMQGAADEITTAHGMEPTKVGLKGNKFGAKVDDLNQDEFIGKVLEKTRRWGDPEEIGAMRDMSRGRFDCDDVDQARAVATDLKDRFSQSYGADNVKVKEPKPSDSYVRWHVLVRDPQTSVWHEWQVGTKALTRFIEGVEVPLPSGVRLHGKPNFHVVMYDVLDKLDDANVRNQHGLDDGIQARIGLTEVQPKYNELMAEAGNLEKGAEEPFAFDIRLMNLADDLGEVLKKLEAESPGITQALDTKLLSNIDTAPKAAAQGMDGVDGPVHHADMPFFSRWKSKPEPTLQDDPLPKLRPEHETGGVEYKNFDNSKAFLSDGKVDPHAAKQGALGDCYLLAGCAAEARANPDGIRSLIKDNGDGTFDVTLHMRESWYDNAKPKVFTVDSRFPARGGNPIYAKVGRSADGEDEMWMPLIEKALAQETGSYDLISGGNINKKVNFGGVHELLTGNKTKYVKTESLSDERLLMRMKQALDSREPIAAGTYNFNDDKSMRSAAESLNIYANHAYSVESVNVDAGTVSLQNPWGSSHPTDVRIEDFKKYYSRLDIGSAPTPRSNVAGGPVHQPDGGEGVAEVLVGDNLTNSMTRAAEVLKKVGQEGLDHGVAGTKSMASGQTRSGAQEMLQESHLESTDIVFPGEGMREALWGLLTSPNQIRFLGTYSDSAAAFFVEPNAGSVIITTPNGEFLDAFSLGPNHIDQLLSTGAF
ncbi:MAG: C2 family cysteine protease [Myxococcota bacterium]